MSDLFPQGCGTTDDAMKKLEEFNENGALNQENVKEIIAYQRQLTRSLIKINRDMMDKYQPRFT